MSGTRDQWEARARDAGVSLRGVLFKGFTPAANKALHGWHSCIVKEVLAPHLPDTGEFLDLGCGYGRLAVELHAAKPTIRILGQDLSFSYCSAFRERCGASVQARIGALPFADGAFAGGMAVTSLMYVDESAIVESLRGIRRVLRPGGVFLIVDPAEETRRLLAAMMFAGKPSTTGGRGYRCSEYEQCAVSAGFRIMRRGGNPRDTARFLFTLGGRFGWRAAHRWLPADDASGSYARFALHRWLLLQAP